MTPELIGQEHYLLGKLLAKSDDHLGTVYNLNELVTPGFSRRQVREAAERLDQRGLVSLSTITMAGARKADDMLMLTPHGLLYCVQAEVDILKAVMDTGSIQDLQSVRDALDRLIYSDEALLPSLYRGGGIPASDRLVDLSDNSAIANFAVIKIEAAVEAIRGSNSLAPDQKDRITQYLDLGLAALKKPKTYVYMITGLLLHPLYSAYSDVVEEAAKPIISAAIDAVRALLGI